MKFRNVFEADAGGDKHRRNIGDSIKGVNQVDHTSKDDMDAFDQLGPKVRDVLNNKMHVKWSSRETLKMMRQMRMNPQDPGHDHAMAQKLSQANDMIRDKIRVVEEVAQELGLI